MSFDIKVVVLLKEVEQKKLNKIAVLARLAITECVALFLVSEHTNDSK